MGALQLMPERLKFQTRLTEFLCEHTSLILSLAPEVAVARLECKALHLGFRSIGDDEQRHNAGFQTVTFMFPSASDEQRWNTTAVCIVTKTSLHLPCLHCEHLSHAATSFSHFGNIQKLHCEWKQSQVLKIGAGGDYDRAVGIDSRLPKCRVEDNAFTWDGMGWDG